MNSLEKLKKLIENSITLIQNRIQELQALKSFDEISSKLQSPDILNLTREEVEEISNYLEEEKDVSEDLNFLQEFVSLEAEMKKFKITYFPFTPAQLQQLNRIKEKIEEKTTKKKSFETEELQRTLVVLKQIQTKFNNNDLNFITETEIDIITGLMEQNKFSLEDKITVYIEIYKINSHIYSNYNVSPANNDTHETDEEQTLDENCLIETNIEESELDELFQKYNINWSRDDRDIKDETKRQKIIKARQDLRSKLLKYGDIAKMDKILAFLKDHSLTFIFNNPEILTNTLLFSDVDMLNSLVDSMTKSNINYKDLIKKQPTILFPPVSENKKVQRVLDSSKVPRYIIGGLTRYFENVRLLNEEGIRPSEVSISSPSFFTLNPKMVRKMYDRLRLYGISFKRSNGITRKGFSIFETADILDKLDIAIESGFYQYYQDNISKLARNFNIYRIKLARSQGLPEGRIFTFRRHATGDVFRVLPNEFQENSDTYGNSPQDTFDKYGAINISEYLPKDKIELYESIIQNSNNDTITDLVLNDNYIKALDTYFKNPKSELEYNFNGVIISRLKVLRFYQTLISNPNINSNYDTLLFAISRLSMLKKEELEQIINSLNQVKIKGRH